MPSVPIGPSASRCESVELLKLAHWALWISAAIGVRREGSWDILRALLTLGTLPQHDPARQRRHGPAPFPFRDRRGILMKGTWFDGSTGSERTINIPSATFAASSTHYGATY